MQKSLSTNRIDTKAKSYNPNPEEIKKLESMTLEQQYKELKKKRLIKNIGIKIFINFGLKMQ